MSSILCLGNFGSGGGGQNEVAELMKYLYSKYKYKLVIGLGNNILPSGVESLNDPQFKIKFEEPYKDLLKSIKFYNILGEADYITKKSVANEIKYSQLNKQWILPHNFYCFKKFINGVPVEFIILDSNLNKTKNKKTQEMWAVNTLLESKSRWNIVISHHPWISFNDVGGHLGDGELNVLYSKLNETKKIDLIISGHENNQQHIYIPNKPNMIISGVGSSSDKSPIIKIYDELKFSSNELGCCMVEFSKTRLNITFYNTNKKKIHNFSIIKY
jgi:tartrate-resistant acid phosphatase type 5